MTRFGMTILYIIKMSLPCHYFGMFTVNRLIVTVNNAYGFVIHWQRIILDNLTIITSPFVSIGSFVHFRII